MHISEGILTPAVLTAGWGATLLGMGIGLKKMKPDKLPVAALMSSAFFLASLVHVPFGPTSVHLVLNGLVGLILGWVAFPAILVALFLQALLFQFGGLIVLGVNTFNMAAPAILAYLLLGKLLRTDNTKILALCGVISAVIGVMGSGLLVAISLALSGEQFVKVAYLVLVAHVPVACIEAVVNAFVLVFMKKTMPKILEEAL